MVGKRNSTLLILAITTLGFVYRFWLTTMNTFPPGADIGLHESVVNSILAPKTSFFYNYYHMGGGTSVTNPGYHIFTSFIVNMTGAPDYLAQAAVASLFSALIILSIFLLVKLVWGKTPAFIAAVLVTFSASDIIMLSWAGYPNIVALTLIPILFYLFLQPSKLSTEKYLTVATVLMAALFLTHLFSAIVFLTIALFALTVGVIFSKRTDFTYKKAISWLIPLAIGALLVSPYLVGVIPVYFGSEGAITGSVSTISQAVVETRLVPTIIMGLAIIPFLLFFAFSKKQTGKFLTLPSILFVSAILIPLAAAQGYLLGFFLDYERFLYFLALPVIVCLALVLVHSVNIISKRLCKIKSTTLSIRFKTVLTLVFIAICLLTPLFALPNAGAAQANFFQVMTPAKYQAIEWARTSTPEGSVFVADAEFGWWLSGFAKRPTLSAVDPQYLILQREFEPAKVASNFMKADYIAENGLLELEQAGPYANGSRHDIYAVSNSSVIKPLVFSLNDANISLLYREHDSPKELNLGDFTDSNTQVANDGNSTTFIITRANQGLRITEEITLFRGVRFAEVTFVFQTDGSVTFDWLHVPFQSRGFTVQYANSIGIVDDVSHVINQIVFPQTELGSDVVMQETSEAYLLVCNLRGSSTAQMRFYVGLCPFTVDAQTPGIDYWNSLIENNSKTYLDSVSNQPINCFDYRTAISQWNISYIALTDSKLIPRFSDDPTFEPAFENSEVTVFKVVNV
ncbi:MAG: hypothetical protein ACQCN6_06235 [Candidatus Bathyarchaeia archaeon]|jgi:hypothetical protein